MPAQGGISGGAPSLPTVPDYTYDSSARFEWPTSLSIGRDDTLYLFDNSLRIRRIAMNGNVVTVPGELPAETAIVQVDSRDDFYVISGQDIYRHYQDGTRQRLTTLGFSIDRYDTWAAIDSRDNLYLLRKRMQGDTVYRVDYAGNLSVFYNGSPLNQYTSGLAVDRNDQVIIHVRESDYDKGELIALSTDGLRSYRDIPGNEVSAMHFDASNNLYLRSVQITDWSETAHCTMGGPCGAFAGWQYYSRVAPNGDTAIFMQPSTTQPPSAEIGNFGLSNLVVDSRGNQYSLIGHGIHKRTPQFEQSVFAGNVSEPGFSD